MNLDRLRDKQAVSYTASTAHANVWEGAVRSSKTVVSVLRWLQFVRAGAPGPLAMIGKTERTLKRNIIDLIESIVGRSRCIYRPSTGELNLFGRTIYICSASDTRAADKIRGMTLVGFYGDELTTWPQEVFEIATTRLSLDGAQWFGTTNPAGPAHYLMDDWLDRAALWIDHDGNTGTGAASKPMDLARFSFTLDDNPSLPAAVVERLKTQYTGLFYQRYILGLWVAAEGAIYDMYDRDRHVVTQLPEIARYVATGVDYGTAGTFAALLIGLGVNGRLYVCSEYSYEAKDRRQKTDPEYSKEYRQWLLDQPVGPIVPEWHCVDPSAASFKTQLRNDGVSSVRDADNDVIDGIRTTAGLLAAGNLFIHQSCTLTQKEIGGYVWDTKAGERGEDKPVKANDHTMDALRYGLHTTAYSWRHDLATPQLATA